MKSILITGGSGFIGTQLCKKLINKGYKVSVLGRTKKQDKEITFYTWDLKNKVIEENAIEKTDCIIHLAGENIGEKRWTKKRKQEIVDSRIKTTQLIFDKVKNCNKKLDVFISASAIGYYGAITSSKIFTENDLPSSDFLGFTCNKWEQYADKFEELGIRTVKIRTGVVLSEKGGALLKMLTPVKLGFASAIGSGKQYIPWIHIDDLCDIYIKALEDDEIKGAYNAVAPEFITNKEFNKTLAMILKKPFWNINIPAIFFKFLLGKMSEIILEGSRISSEKIIEKGYKFKFTNLRSALENLLTTNSK